MWAYKGVEGKGHVEELVYQAIVRYFKDRNMPNLSIQRTKVDEMKVILYVSNLRREILKNEKYWEALQLDFSMRKTQNQLQISLITDAEIGNGAVLFGLGNPPRDDDYSPIEPRYSKELKRYSTEFLYRIKDFLTQKE